MISMKCREAASAMRIGNLKLSKKLHSECPGCSCQCRYDLGDRAISQPSENSCLESPLLSPDHLVSENSNEGPLLEKSKHQHNF